MAWCALTVDETMVAGKNEIVFKTIPRVSYAVKNRSQENHDGQKEALDAEEGLVTANFAGVCVANETAAHG